MILPDDKLCWIFPDMENKAVCSEDIRCEGQQYTVKDLCESLAESRAEVVRLNAELQRVYEANKENARLYAEAIAERDAAYGDALRAAAEHFPFGNESWVGRCACGWKPAGDWPHGEEQWKQHILALSERAK